MTATAFPASIKKSFMGGLTASWNRYGWIGLDIGSHSVKVGQLERRDDNLTWRAMYAFPWEPVIDSGTVCGPFESLRQPLKSLRSLFRGRDVACLLSMSLAQLRSLELAEDDPVRFSAALAKEFDHDPSDPCCIAHWTIPGPASGESARHTAIAVPERLTRQIGQTLVRAGWECVVLDALPCVLARLPGFMDGTDAPLTAVLDLGYENSTFVIAREGDPLFTRQLRGINFQAVLQRTGSSLGLSDDEARQLLVRYGIRRDGKGPHAGKIAAANLELLAAPLQNLVRELERTLAYAEQQWLPRLKPEKLLLTGATSLVAGIDDYLADEIHLAVHAWRLPAAPEEPSLPARSRDSLYASVAALSTLAWEAVDVR